MALCVQEPLPKPDRVPQLEALLSAKNEDDDEELERLALGLKVIDRRTPDMADCPDKPTAPLPYTPGLHRRHCQYTSSLSAVAGMLRRWRRCLHACRAPH